MAEAQLFHGIHVVPPHIFRAVLLLTLAWSAGVLIASEKYPLGVFSISKSSRYSPLSCHPPAVRTTLQKRKPLPTRLILLGGHHYRTQDIHFA
jgi:hypothetical protein